jgi:hypothetical protein
MARAPSPTLKDARLDVVIAAGRREAASWGPCAQALEHACRRRVTLEREVEREPYGRGLVYCPAARFAGALVYGGNRQFNIPYQFDSMAVPANPDIKVVITDGGGNDILIDNRQCLTTAVQGDTQCHMVIDAVVAKAKQLLQDMASKGVQHIVYMFYPHIDTTAIFTGPDANDWLDYVYPLAPQLSGGATTAPQGAPDLTCHGSPASGVDCTFIDTRPELAGHNDPNNKSTYWRDGLGIHPTQPGTDLIVAKMWAQMQKYCIAQ